VDGALDLEQLRDEFSRLATHAAFGGDAEPTLVVALGSVDPALRAFGALLVMDQSQVEAGAVVQVQVGQWLEVRIIVPRDRNRHRKPVERPGRVPRRVYRTLLARGLGSAEVAAAPDSLIEALRLSARRPENARTVASLMHAIDLFRRPRPESVLTSAELAAIMTPTIFIIGSDDPYLSTERARPSIDQIHGARLYEVPGGHAPWLVDAQRAAELIATHSHLATGC